MASEDSQSPEAPALTVFVPFLLGFSVSHTPQQGQQVPEPEAPQSSPLPERIILINPFTQSMVVMGPNLASEPLFSSKPGRPPASKASIDAMPRVKIEEGCECECAICLEELGVGEVAREMPCKHRFHGGCVEKWLGLHGTCPVCRYEMPEEEGRGGGEKGEEGGERRSAGSGGVWVGFALDFGGRVGDVNSSPSSSPPSQDGEN